MVVIRLKREGNRNRPYYRIVVSDSRRARDGKFIEEVGSYDPKELNQTSPVKIERIDYWVGQGARMTETVTTLVRKARKAAVAA